MTLDGAYTHTKDCKMGLHAHTVAKNAQGSLPVIRLESVDVLALASLHLFTLIGSHKVKVQKVRSNPRTVNILVIVRQSFFVQLHPM